MTTAFIADFVLFLCSVNIAESQSENMSISYGTQVKESAKIIKFKQISVSTKQISITEIITTLKQTERVLTQHSTALHSFSSDPLTVQQQYDNDDIVTYLKIRFTSRVIVQLSFYNCFTYDDEAHHNISFTFI